MKRIAIIGLSLMLVMVVLAGCGPKAQPTPAKPAPAATAAPTATPAAQLEPYKIGTLFSTTGTGAASTEPALKAAELFIDALNKTGGIKGHPVQLISYDGGSTAEGAVTGFKKLVNEDKVMAINGPYLSTEIQPLQPFIRTQGPLVVVTSSSALPEPNTYLFDVSSTTSVSQEMLIPWFQKRGITTFGMIADTTQTGQVAVDSFNKLATKYNLTFFSERFEATDVDVTPQLSRLKAKNPGAIICWSSGAQAAMVIKNYDQLGLGQPLVISPANFNASFIKLVKDVKIKELLIVAVRSADPSQLPADDPQRPLAEWMIKTYTTRLNREADIVSAGVGMDSMAALVSAIMQAGTDSTKQKEYLESQQGVAGAVTVADFSAQNHISLSTGMYGLVRVSNGQFTSLVNELPPFKASKVWPAWKQVVP